MRSSGVRIEGSQGAQLTGISVEDACYAFHPMFASAGRGGGLSSRRAVVGLMVMESRDWSIVGSSFFEGYRTGSAGLRLQNPTIATRPNVPEQLLGCVVRPGSGGPWHRGHSVSLRLLPPSSVAVRTAARPWSGVFLGSPWTQISQSLRGGEVLGVQPLVRAPSR